MILWGISGDIYENIANHHKELKKFANLADQIDALDGEYTKLTDYELKAKTDDFKGRLS